MKRNLCHGYNLRLPACFMERYASYWFEANCKVKYLSHARLGGLCYLIRLTNLLIL